MVLAPYNMIITKRQPSLVQAIVFRITIFSAQVATIDASSPAVAHTAYLAQYISFCPIVKILLSLAGNQALHAYIYQSNPVSYYYFLLLNAVSPPIN